MIRLLLSWIENTESLIYVYKAAKKTYRTLTYTLSLRSRSKI